MSQGYRVTVTVNRGIPGRIPVGLGILAEPEMASKTSRGDHIKLLLRRLPLTRALKAF